MSTQQEPQEELISDKQVAEYLQQHKDFFTHHTELLTELRVPHDAGTAVSLIERQVDALREQNALLKNKLTALVEVGHENENLSRRVQHLTLALLETHDQTHMLEMLHRELHDEFEVDAVAIHLRNLAPDMEAKAGFALLANDDPVIAAHDKQFIEHLPVCGRLTEDQRIHVFAADADNVASVALVPLGPDAEDGLLGIGSKDPQRFHSGADTLFLKYLGDFIWRILKRFEHENTRSE